MDVYASLAKHFTNFSYLVHPCSRVCFLSQIIHVSTGNNFLGCSASEAVLLCDVEVLSVIFLFFLSFSNIFQFHESLVTFSVESID